jgi:V8-like Glu-specific endopeptidase
MRFTRDDISLLARIIDSFPHPDGLRLSFENWLFDSLEHSKILGDISFAGGTQLAARNAVIALERLGRYAPGRSYLHDLVTTLIDTVSSIEDKVALRELALRISPDGAIPPPVFSDTLPIGLYKGQDVRSADTQERVIGENTLRPYYYLQLGVEAGKAVCLIRLPNGVGTGFLIARNLIMTNNHVVPAAGMLPLTQALFRYEKNSDGTEKASIVVSATENSAFLTSPVNNGLDATIFAIDEASAHRLAEEDIRPLAISQRSVKEQERVTIIQHPGGQHKQVSLQNNKIQYADSEIIDYTTTTLPGSSGAPVFDDRFHVVGLHRQGVQNSEFVYYRNRGTSMCAIIRWLTEHGAADRLIVVD